MRVVIAGAGIGGLVTARGLAQRGHEVVLLERAPSFGAVGAGIILGANAMAVLRALGIDPRPAGLKLSRLDVTDGNGAVISGMILPDGDLGEVYAFHRAELHDALAAALPASVDVRFGVEITAIEAERDGVIVRTAESSIAGDAVIGADGIRSRARAAVHPDARLSYSGQTCWRVVVPAADVPGTVEAWGRDGDRFGVVPLRDGRAYVFLVAPAPAGAQTPPWDEMNARFGAFGGTPARVWPAVRPEALLHRDLEGLDAPVWGSPRIWLLGDAAHAMTPNLGQGAGMAIEDAGAIGLHFGADLPAAHAAYVAARHARASSVLDQSARLGRLAALQSPVARWLRDTALRLTPTAVAARAQAGLLAPGIALARQLTQ